MYPTRSTMSKIITKLNLNIKYSKTSLDQYFANKMSLYSGSLEMRLVRYIKKYNDIEYALTRNEFSVFATYYNCDINALDATKIVVQICNMDINTILFICDELNAYNLITRCGNISDYVPVGVKKLFDIILVVNLARALNTLQFLLDGNFPITSLTEIINPFLLEMKKNINLSFDEIYKKYYEESTMIHISYHMNEYIRNFIKQNNYSMTDYVTHIYLYLYTNIMKVYNFFAKLSDQQLREYISAKQDLAFIFGKYLKCKKSFKKNILKSCVSMEMISALPYINYHEVMIHDDIIISSNKNTTTITQLSIVL
jgi:hypothetical protein